MTYCSCNTPRPFSCQPRFTPCVLSSDSWSPPHNMPCWFASVSPWRARKSLTKPGCRGGKDCKVSLKGVLVKTWAPNIKDIKGFETTQGVRNGSFLKAASSGLLKDALQNSPSAAISSFSCSVDSNFHFWSDVMPIQAIASSSHKSPHQIGEESMVQWSWPSHHQRLDSIPCSWQLGVPAFLQQLLPHCQKHSRSPSDETSQNLERCVPLPRASF